LRCSSVMVCLVRAMVVLRFWWASIRRQPWGQLS
jgi:hypothetical protein